MLVIERTGKVRIGMSGGVDSSVAVHLLLKQGYDCCGAMMKLHGGTDTNDCTIDARAVAERFGISFCVLDYSDIFAREVLSRFISAYREGKTPNPCVDCNREMKFGVFLDNAIESGMQGIATGHYARVECDGASGRYLLKKGIDQSRDQSYFLYSLTQRQLSHTLFPLGGLLKSQVREIALEQGLHNANRGESQDICFIPNGKYAAFIEEYTGEKPVPGYFMDSRGNILGRHKGVIHYTIGQRKGLGISTEIPLYVCEILPERSTVVLGGHEELFSQTLTVRDINLIPIERINSPIRVTAKIRYRQPEQTAILSQLDENTLYVEFDTSQRAVTKGQAAVFYDGDTVIGGGTIV